MYFYLYFYTDAYTLYFYLCFSTYTYTSTLLVTLTIGSVGNIERTLNINPTINVSKPKVSD